MISRKLFPDKYLLIIYIALLVAGLVSIYGAQTIHEPNGSYFNNHLKLLSITKLLIFNSAFSSGITISILLTLSLILRTDLLANTK